MPLETAPDHIKLAVDLIQLLESHHIDNRISEAALEIVLDDVRRKIAAERSEATHSVGQPEVLTDDDNV